MCIRDRFTVTCHNFTARGVPNFRGKNGWESADRSHGNIASHCKVTERRKERKKKKKEKKIKKKKKKEKEREKKERKKIRMKLI